MNEKNLPIKLVLQRTSDIKKNQPGGGSKFFGEVTEDLKNDISEQFEKLLDFKKMN